MKGKTEYAMVRYLDNINLLHQVRQKKRNEKSIYFWPKKSAYS